MQTELGLNWSDNTELKVKFLKYRSFVWSTDPNKDIQSKQHMLTLTEGTENVWFFCSENDFSRQSVIKMAAD